MILAINDSRLVGCFPIEAHKLPEKRTVINSGRVVLLMNTDSFVWHEFCNYRLDKARIEHEGKRWEFYNCQISEVLFNKEPSGLDFWTIKLESEDMIYVGERNSSTNNSI